MDTPTLLLIALPILAVAGGLAVAVDRQLTRQEDRPRNRRCRHGRDRAGDVVEVVMAGCRDGHHRIVRVRVREAYPVPGGVEITGQIVDEDIERTIRVPDEFVQVVGR